MDRQTAAELRLEPCGLWRHYVAGISNVDELLHRYRVESESNLHLTVVDSARKLAKSADSADEIDPLVCAEVLDAENLVKHKV